MPTIGSRTTPWRVGGSRLGSGLCAVRLPAASLSRGFCFRPGDTGRRAFEPGPGAAGRRGEPAFGLSPDSVWTLDLDFACPRLTPALRPGIVFIWVTAFVSLAKLFESALQVTAASFLLQRFPAFVGHCPSMN